MASDGPEESIAMVFQGAVPIEGVNALRRVLLDGTPCQAVDKVAFGTNSTQFYDEFLAHRIGLVPLRQAPQLESATYSIDITVPQDSANCYNVTARDMVQLSGPPMPPTHPGILIAPVAPGESLRAVITTSSGVAAQHAKWSLVTTATCRRIPRIDVAPDIEDLSASICPVGVFETIADRGLVATRPDNCTLCRQCVRNAPPGAICIDTSPEANTPIVLHVETVGQLPALACVLQGIHALRKQLNKIAENLLYSLAAAAACLSGSSSKIVFLAMAPRSSRSKSCQLTDLLLLSSSSLTSSIVHSDLGASELAAAAASFFAAGAGRLADPAAW